MNYMRTFVPVRNTQSRAEKMLDAFFDPRDNSVRSFRECYSQITGDRRVTGSMKNCDQGAMREALDSTSWSNALGDAVNRRMLAEYKVGSQYTVWRKLARIVGNVRDFRTQSRTRYGGYGDLPAVIEGDPYPALPSPADESASYAVSKRGGTETITLEMVKNDDVHAIQSIPKRLAQAAQRTLARFVLDFLAGNAAIYDGLALFDVNHNNLGTAALSAAAVDAGRAAMSKQTEPGSGDRLGLTPQFLWVPFDLEETGVNIFRRGANIDRTFVQDLKLDVIPVWYWTDTNDWCISVDPANAPTVEIAFLDGQEEPDLILQDSPTGGALFSNDQLTWKIRHCYGGAVVDYRGIYKSVV